MFTRVYLVEIFISILVQTDHQQKERPPHTHIREHLNCDKYDIIYNAENIIYTIQLVSVMFSSYIMLLILECLLK